MATAPVKSQPLHNFSLPFLKWGGTAKNPAAKSPNHHRSRRPHSSDQPSETESDPDTRPSRIGSRPNRNTIRYSLSPNRHPPPSDDDQAQTKRDADVAPESEETAHKPWNLRPRKPAIPRGAVEIGSRGGNGEPSSHEPGHNVHGEPKSMRLRGLANEAQCGGERKEKRKFWIALSRDEIEEDIFVMTGSRPSRKPRRRPKTVQKQIDSVFPGLWLVGVTADSYRVAETPAKK